MAAIAHFAQPDPGSSSAYSSSYDSSLLQWPQSLGTVTNADQSYLVGPGSSYVWDTQEAIHPSSSYSSSSSSHPSSSASFPPPPSFQSHLPSPSYHPPSYVSSSDYQPPPYQASSNYSNTHSSSHASNSYPPHYPESSQRTVLTGAAHPASSGVLPSALSGRSYFSGTRSYTALAASSTPRLERATWDSAELYTIEPATEPAPRQPSPRVNVKEEDTDCAGAFIFELAPSEPTCDTMPEVPLRATQAPPAMRKMMTSFRLDPFAMHNGIRSAAVAAGPGGVEIGPLREEPVIIEWQVHLDFPLVPQDDAPAQALPSRRRGWAAHRRASPALAYPLDDEADEDRWEAPASLEYTAFSSPGDSPEFEPLMTPAQSLNWSMRYQPTSSIDEHAAYPMRMGGGRGRATGAQEQYVEYDMYRPAPTHAHAHSRHNDFQDYFPPSNSWYRSP